MENGKLKEKPTGIGKVRSIYKPRHPLLCLVKRLWRLWITVSKGIAFVRVSDSLLAKMLDKVNRGTRIASVWCHCVMSKLMVIVS